MKLYLASAVLVLGFSTAGLHAATEDYIINKFDNSSEAAGWSRWWGAAPQSYEFDGTVDADGNPNSGSLRVTVNFDKVAYGGDNQFSALKNFAAPLNGTEYTNMVFDLLWDPSSPQRPWGDFGSLEYGFRNLDYSQTYVGTLGVPTNGGWIHVVAPISPTLPKLDTIAGAHLKMWSGDPTWGQTGTAIFWIDNIKLVAITNGVEIPPPTVSLTKPTPGLNLIASQSGGQYQRQNIRTAGTGYSWIDSFDEVEFAITISKYPSAAYNNFQTHLFLCAPSALPYGAGDNSPDYNATNAIFFMVANNADGTAYARFAFKTNQPSGNSMFYNSDPGSGPVGSLATIGDSTPLGTWKLKFLYDVGGTFVTVTTPSGSVTNFTMPAEAVELFADHANGNPMYAWVGTQPNNLGSIGQAAVISHVRINRDIVLIDDDFTTGLNPLNWQVVASDPPGVVPVTTDAAYWFSWTVPDTGFSPQISAEVANPAAWQPLSLTPIQILGEKRVLVPSTALPSPETGFFRMLKPPPPTP